MKRFLIPSVLLLAMAASGFADDDAVYAAGQKYLEKLGKSWAEQLPPERVTGLYLGRRWGGVMRFSVKAAPADSGAAFEITCSADMGAEGRKMESHALLGANLEPVSGDISEESRRGKRLTKVLVKSGRWQRIVEVGGRTNKSEGELKPGTTWEAKSLMFFAAPEDEYLAIRELMGERSVVVIRKTKERREADLGGKVLEYDCFDMVNAPQPPGVAYIGEDGRAAQVAFVGGTTRLIAIDAAAIGKDLDIELIVAPPTRALIELFKALKRGDKAAVVAGFDIVKFTENMTDGYASMDDAKKKAAQEGQRQKIADQLLGPLLLSRVPAVDEIEGIFPLVLKCIEKKDTAEIFDPFGQTWQMYRTADGRWLVYGMRQS